MPVLNNQEELDQFFKYGKSNLNPQYKPELLDENKKVKYKNPTREELALYDINPIGPDLENFPVNEPVGQLFEPYGGVKKIDKNLTDYDLDDIPEARAQSQSAMKLIGNALGQTLTEATVGMVQGVGYLFNNDLYKGDLAERDFENQWSEAFGKVKEDINENLFPIYQSHNAQEGSFIEKLQDPTYWAANFSTVASTASMFLTGMGAAALAGRAGSLLKLGAKGTKMFQSVVAAGTSRLQESTMEASQRFKSSYDIYKQTMSDEEARLKAGEDASKAFKYNTAMFAVDLLQFSSILKPFEKFAEASRMAKVANKAVQPVGEAFEEGYQFIGGEEAAQDKPFGSEFFNERFSDYLHDPEMQSSMFWGAMGGAIVGGLAKPMEAVAKSVEKYSSRKMSSAAFGDKESFDKTDQDVFNQILSRNFMVDNDKFSNLNKVKDDIDVFGQEELGKEEYTPEQKQEIQEKVDNFKTQVEFLKAADNELRKSPTFKNAPDTRKTYALQQLEAKVVAQNMNKLTTDVDNFYNNLEDAYKPYKDLNKAKLKLGALATIPILINQNKKLPKDDKSRLLDIARNEISKQKEVVKELEEQNKDLKNIIIPNELSVLDKQVKYEQLKFKHDNIIQPELLKYSKLGDDSVQEEETKIKTKKSENIKKAAEKVAKDVTTPEATSKFEEGFKNVSDEHGVQTDNESLNSMFDDASIPPEKGNVITTSPIGNVELKFIPTRWNNPGIKGRYKKEMNELADELNKTETLQDIAAKVRAASSNRKNFLKLVDENKTNPQFVTILNGFFEKKDKQYKFEEEEKELLRIVEELKRQNGDIDSNVQPESIEPEDLQEPEENVEVPTNNILHINPLQYSFEIIELNDGKKIKVPVGDLEKWTSGKGWDWDFINKMPVGTKLIAKYDPNYILINNKKEEFKNSDLKYAKQVISLYNESGEMVGLMYSAFRDESVKETFKQWKREIYNSPNGKEFTVVQKYKGQIHTLEGDYNTISQVKPNGDDIILGYVRGTKHGLEMITPNRESIPVRLPKSARPGQIFVALPKGNGTYFAYPLVTKTLYQGVDTNTMDTKIEGNTILQKVINLLKEFPTSDDRKGLTRELSEIVNVPFKYYQKKDKSGVYMFNPANITDRVIENLKQAGATVHPKVKQDSTTNAKEAYGLVVRIPESLITNLDTKSYNTILDFIGNMRLQIASEDLNIPSKLQKISNRTLTNLSTNPIVNVSFFIQPSTEAIELKVGDVVELSSGVEEQSVLKEDVKEQVQENHEVIPDKIEKDDIVDEDGDEGDIDDGYFDIERKRTGKDEYEIWDEEKERKWLSENIPNIEIQDLDVLGILDPNQYGMFKNGIIYLSKNTKIGTAYHEAFHAVFWLGLTDAERTNIINQKRGKNKNLTDLEIEEILAEDFIDYINNDTLPTGNFIQKFFKMLKRWIESNIFHHPSIDTLYYNINTGKYKNVKPIPGQNIERKRQRSQLKPSVFENRVNTLVSNFSKAIDSYISYHNFTGSVEELLRSGKHSKYNNIIEMFLDKSYKRIKKYAEKHKGKNPEWDVEMSIFLDEIKKGKTENGRIVFGPIGEKAFTKIARKEGFKIVNNKVKAVSQVDQSENEDIELYENNSKLDGWQIDIKSQSGEMGLSSEVRRELSRVKLQTRDDLGFSKYLDFESAYATLKRDLSNLFSAERIENKLAEIVKIHEEYKGIYEKFKSDPLFRTKFTVDFSKAHVEFKIVIQKSNGDIRVYSSNGNTTSNRLVKEWETHFYNKGYINVDGTINKAKIEPLLENFRTSEGKLKEMFPMEKIKLFNDLFELDLDDKLFTGDDVPMNNEVGNLTHLVNDLLDYKNIFETNPTKVKTLASLNVKYILDSLESSFRNIAGKTVYSHLVPGFIAKQISSIKNDFKSWYDFYSTDVFYKNAPIVKDMLENPKFMNSLDWSLVDGMKYNGETTGTSYADFNDKQFASFGLNMFFNNNSKELAWYQAPILSDSPEGIFVQMPKYDITKVIEKLVEVSVQEESRMDDPTNEINNVKHYQKNAKKYHFLDLPTSFKDLTDTDKKTEIKRILNDKFEIYWKHLIDSNVFTLNDNFGVSRELLGFVDESIGLGDVHWEKLKDFAKEYFYNQTYASSQIITLTTGDPSYYKNIADFYKRSKEMISPTLQMDTTATFNSKVTGETITPGDSYRTIYVNDVEVMGKIAQDMWNVYEETKDIFYAKIAAKYGYSNHTVKNEKGEDVKFVKIDDNYSILKEYLYPFLINELEKYNVKIEQNDSQLETSKTNAYYSPSNNTIYLPNDLSKINSSVIEEEVIHAILQNLYKQRGKRNSDSTINYADLRVSNGRSPYNAGSIEGFEVNLKKLLKSLEFEFDKTKKDLNDVERNTIENILDSANIQDVEELIAKGLASPFFMDWLQTLPSTNKEKQFEGENNKTIWDEIINDNYTNFKGTELGHLLYLLDENLSSEYDGKDIIYDKANHSVKTFSNNKSNTVYFKTKPVNATDAQTFITPERYRKIGVGFGRWTDTIETTFNKIINNEKLSPDDYDIVLNPYKPFVFGHIKQGSKIVPVQNKNSEYMLTPQLIEKSPTLKGIYDTLQKHHSDSMSFESVVKVGLSDVVTLDDLLNDRITERNIHTLNNSDFGLQQEIPEHYIDADSLFGTQIMKHIIANIDLEGDYDGITGRELVKEYQDLIIENLRTSYINARDELGITDDVIDNQKLSNLLEREIIERDLGEDLREAIMLDANGNLNLDLPNPLHRDRNEKLLNSIYKNRVTKQKFKGGALVQVSGIGFSEKLHINYKNGKIDSVDCMLPWSSRKHFEPFLDEKGQIDIKKVPEDLLKMVGYRIPTEDKYSMLPLKVVGFLPSISGGAVMLPIEITTLSGSDFDVDKLYIMMPEFKIRKRYDYKKVVNALKEYEGISTSFKEVEESFKKDTPRHIELNSKIKELPDDLDIYLEPTIEKVTNIDTVEGRNNRLLDLMYSVLTNENTLKQFIQPGGYADVTKYANTIWLVSAGIGSYSEVMTWDESKVESEIDKLMKKEGIDLTNPMSNAIMFNRNMAGKKLVGIFANHNANHSMIQHTNLKLKEDISFNGHVYNSLNNTKNINNQLISNELAQFLAAVVDNAKDPNAFKVNLNTFTSDIAALMVRLGIPMNETFLFLSQPILKEVSKLYFNYDDEGKALNEIRNIFKSKYEKFPPLKDIKDINDIDINTDTLIGNLRKTDIFSRDQGAVFIKFIKLLEYSKSLRNVVRAMSPMNNGNGPNMADNESLLLLQEDVLKDDNLIGVNEIFDGTVYPMFNAFNQFGFKLPHNDLARLFPLSNLDQDAIINLLKQRLRSYIGNKNLSVKEIKKFNDFVMSYIGTKLDFYTDKEYILKEFPNTYKRYKEKSEFSNYRIANFINYVQDNNLPFGRLEFNNTGAVTPTLKDDIKANFVQLLTHDDKNIRQFGLNLIKYSFFKEGFIFGPKTFAHLTPTQFFTEILEGTEVNEKWHQIFKSENLSLIYDDVDTIIEQFIKNNWKNPNYAPVIAKDAVQHNKNNQPIEIVAGTDNTDLFVKGSFMEFAKVPINPKAEKVEYILFKKYDVTLDLNGLPYQAKYLPTNKLGKYGMLMEVEAGIKDLKSILPENNLPDNLVVNTEMLEPIIESVDETTPVINYKYEWSRYSDNSYEVSSAGDKRFSALFAKLKDGRTIEEVYQLDIKGYRKQGNDWKLGKGKPPIKNISKEELWNEYKNLWKIYLNENPQLLNELKENAKGKVLTDKFASTDISQARALVEILNETIPIPTETLKSQNINNNSFNTIPLNTKFSRNEVEKDSDYIYLFTDNAERKSGSNKIDSNSWYSKTYGIGKTYPTMTQAVIRGLNNAFPITTMVNDKRVQWNDSQFEIYKNIIDQEIQQIKDNITSGKFKGIKFSAQMPFGKGQISNMKENAPNIFKYMNQKLLEIGIDNNGNNPIPTESLKSQPKQLSLQFDNTKQDLIDNYDMYKSLLGDITVEDIQNADSEQLGEILKRICKK